MYPGEPADQQREKFKSNGVDDAFKNALESLFQEALQARAWA